MSISFEVKITNNSPRVLAALDEQIPVALTAAGMQAETLCAMELQNAPRRIDTGRLFNSITSQVDGKTCIIGTDVKYAIYVHEGTSSMIPNRFLRNGLENNVDVYKSILEEYLNR